MRILVIFVENISHGDYKKVIWAYNFGDVVCLPEIMSTYNYGNTLGLTYKNVTDTSDSVIEKILSRKKCLKEYNKLTNFKHSDIVNKRLEEIDFSVLKIKALSLINKKSSKEEIKDVCNKIFKSSYYKELSILEKIKIIARLKLRIKI